MLIHIFSEEVDERDFLLQILVVVGLRENSFGKIFVRKKYIYIYSKRNDHPGNKKTSILSFELVTFGEKINLSFFSNYDRNYHFGYCSEGVGVWTFGSHLCVMLEAESGRGKKFALFAPLSKMKIWSQKIYVDYTTGVTIWVVTSKVGAVLKIINFDLQ